MNLNDGKFGQVIYNTNFLKYGRIVGLLENTVLKKIMFLVVCSKDDESKPLIWDPDNCRILTPREIGYILDPTLQEQVDMMSSIEERKV